MISKVSPLRKLTEVGSKTLVPKKHKSSLLSRRKFAKKKLLSVETVPKTELCVDRHQSIKEKYEVEDKIGFGTYSQVKLVTEKYTCKQFVAKISSGETSINLLKNEYKILSKIRSPFIPFVKELHIEHCIDKAYLIMELIEGVTLDQYAKDKGIFKPSEVWDIMKQLCQWVEYLHMKQISHRDIKPTNIIMTPNGALKLIDFNISKSWENSEDDENKFKGLFFTQISSPLYAAPELELHESYNEAIDIWGIGIIWKYIAKLEPESSENEIIETISDDYEANLEDFLSQTTNKDPSKRPTASECLNHPLLN